MKKALSIALTACLLTGALGIAVIATSKTNNIGKTTNSSTLNAKASESNDAIVKLKSSKSSSSSSKSSKYIGTKKAKEIALKHAGVKASSIRDYEIELDKDNDIMVYEIEFESGRKEYEYVIDAITGDILEWDID